MKVLIVEDQPDLGDIAGPIVSDLGCDVHTVEDAVRALECLETGGDPDLLFADIVMPGGASTVPGGARGESHPPGSPDDFLPDTWPPGHLPERCKETEITKASPGRIRANRRRWHPGGRRRRPTAGAESLRVTRRRPSGARPVGARTHAARRSPDHRRRSFDLPVHLAGVQPFGLRPGHRVEPGGFRHGDPEPEPAAGRPMPAAEIPA